MSRKSYIAVVDESRGKGSSNIARLRHPLIDGGIFLKDRTSLFQVGLQIFLILVAMVVNFWYLGERGGNGC